LWLAEVQERVRTYSTNCARAPASTCTVVTILTVAVKGLVPCVPKTGVLGINGEESEASHLVREDHWGVDRQS
jgi:hypothetical protein